MKKLLTSLLLLIPFMTYSQSIPISGDQYHLYGPNSTWGEYLKVGGNGRNTTNASVVTTNGNLHLDAKDGKYLYLNHYNTGNTLMNTNGGNVGIGTSAIQWKLNIGGEQHPRILMKSNSNGTGNEVGIGFTNYDESEFYEIGLDNEGKNSFHIGNKYFLSKYFTINSLGKIGIGTDSPTEKLDVNGNIRLLKSGNKIYWDWTNRAIEQYSSDGNSRMIRFVNSMGPGQGNPDGGFDFADYLGNSVLRINNHTVGIGTTETGTHKLAVDGTIGAREVKVEGGTWSDFVFKEEYPLKDIKEVEAFIKQNQHLPDIPSEKEVMENGIELGKMDAKLLQKIEELTLYIIEMNKEMETLKNQVNKLQEENISLKDL